MVAGFGKGTICFPEELFPVEGFCGIHDNPHVRLMVLKTKTAPMALLAAELVNVPRTAIETWQKQIGEAFEILPEQVLVHMTHAITTPHEPGPMGPPDRRPLPTAEDERKKTLFHSALNAAVSEAIAEAEKNMGEVMWGWGKGSCLVNVNRDMETPFGWWIGARGNGPSNHCMTVLRMNGADGQAKGMLVSFGLKPCAVDNAGMKDGTRLVSSEVCGAFCMRMEEKYGVPILYCMSAAGDQVPRKMALTEYVSPEGKVCQKDEGVEQGFIYVEELSREMYEAAVAIVENICCTEQAEEAGWENVSFSWQRRKGSPRKLEPVQHIPDGETVVTSEIFRLGNTAFAAVKPEITTPVEALLLDQSPYEHTILLSMTNGEAKYLPEQDAFDRGTWEAQSSMLMPGAAEKLILEIIKGMKSLL